jgi:hypothetical protein
MFVERIQDAGQIQAGQAPEAAQPPTRRIVDTGIAKAPANIEIRKLVRRLHH